MQCARNRYPASFGPAVHTMRLSMWQRGIAGVACYIRGCFNVLGGPDAAPYNALTTCHLACG